MTFKEAIKTIQVAIAEVEWEYPTDYSVAFETAIKSLEKQVGKTPKKIGKQHYACPLCDSILNISYDDIFVYEMPLPNYCETCGQYLEWENIE